MCVFFSSHYLIDSELQQGRELLCSGHSRTHIEGMYEVGRAGDEIQQIRKSQIMEYLYLKCHVLDPSEFGFKLESNLLRVHSTLVSGNSVENGCWRG